jgi:signal transduction histidine kinase/phage shock protein PspC (stress-responsive transcriptional regulator)
VARLGTPWDHREITERSSSPPGSAPNPWPPPPPPAGRPSPGPGADDTAAEPLRRQHGRHHLLRRSKPQSGPLRRSTTDRLVGGVAGGLAARTGIDATVIRVVFLVLSAAGGTGFSLYMLGWVLIPREGDPVSIGRRAMTDRHALAPALAFVTALIGILLTLQALGLTVAANLIWPTSLGLAGLVIVWRNAAPDEKSELHELMEQTPLVGASATRSRRATVVRILLGAVLVVAGLTGLVGTRHPTGTTVRTLLAAAVVVIGFLIAFGPWWLRLVRDLSDERRERVRTQERADMAAHLHDSVLQTLALIQRSADDPHTVTRLARAQERELRGWLFEARPPGAFDEATVSTLAQGVAVIERDVEDDVGTPVTSVVVGDCALDDELRALLAAGREAAVNAAKWSGASSVSIYAEVESSRISLYVRDRGKGFDPDAVDGGRQGIATSIRARMARHGGSAEIRSAFGEGTEVRLVMPRRKESR